MPLPEKVKEPPRPNHIGSQGLSPPPQLAVSGDECDRLTGGLRHDINEHVIAAPSSVEDRDAVVHATLYALAGLAF